MVSKRQKDLSVTDIVLCALNARYLHTAFGVRYLLANLGPLRSRALLLEFNLDTRAEDIVEAILLKQPQIVGLGVYIWNASLALSVVRVLRKVSPETTIVLGGPEVSHEIEGQALLDLADYVIQGEGEVAFQTLSEAILGGDPPSDRILHAAPVDLNEIVLPYDTYDAEDIAHRVIYVEASRGCPFHCAFCLSALDRGVRYVDRGRLFLAFRELLRRGVRHFKFVDRTFNLRLDRTLDVLSFFETEAPDDVFLHFEWVPERLGAKLLAALEVVDPTRVQLEVGIQSLNPDVLKAIAIRRDLRRVEANVRTLVELGVHLHADLIAGLPGEDLASFGEGFDRLHAWGVDEIQLGLLKRLRGAPITATEFAMLRFAEEAPYDVIASDAMDFFTLQGMKRLAYLWDRVGNSGNFMKTLPLLASEGSLFRSVVGFSEAIFAQEGRVHAIALDRLTLLLRDYLVNQGLCRDVVEATLINDYRRVGRKLPRELRDGEGRGRGRVGRSDARLPKRQARHHGEGEA